MDKIAEVTINLTDGQKQELSGDTVICYTVSNVRKSLEGKAEIEAYTYYGGTELPELLFPMIFSRLTCDLIDGAFSGDKEASIACMLITIRALEDKIEEIRKS